MAKEQEIVIIAGLFEKQAPGVYFNSAVVINADGSSLEKYRKMHIPEDPFYYEKYYFTPGDLGYQVFKSKYTNIGVLIYWDQWFPEAARLTAMKSAEIMVPSARPTITCFNGSHSFQEFTLVFPSPLFIF